MHTYSRRWYDTYLLPIPSERTDPEVDFLLRQLPLATYWKVLDVCCGAGRHAVRLAEAGHRVTGVDLEEEVLGAAGSVAADNPLYLVADMRDLSALDGESFDAALIMWQSWGHLTREENDAVLADLASRLRAGGRFVLDVYHRHFFERHQGVRERVDQGRPVVETKSMRGNRLRVELAYDDGQVDRHEWEVLTPEELAERTRASGFEPVLMCAGFDETVAPVGDQPRFQAIFERI